MLLKDFRVISSFYHRHDIFHVKEILSFDSRILGFDSNINGRLFLLNQAVKNSVYMLEQISVKSKLDKIRSDYIKNLTTLENLNPMSVLKRGYSITFDENGKLLDYDSLKKNMTIVTKVEKGCIISRVIDKKENEIK